MVKHRRKRKGHKGYCVKAGKKKLKKFRKKTSAKKFARGRRKRGLKARIVPCRM